MVKEYRHKLTGKLLTQPEWFALPYEKKNDYYMIETRKWKSKLSGEIITDFQYQHLAFVHQLDFDELDA